jgi:hypothetical protein
VLTSVKELAGKILESFRQAARNSEQADIPVASIFGTFLKESPHDMVQGAIEYLADRDFIAPFSYSLTAKGRKESLKTGEEERS